MFRILCTLVGIVSVFYGSAYTLAPDFVAGLYLPAPNAEAALVGRFVGLSMLFIGIACWLIRDTSDPIAKKAISVAGLVSSIVGFATSLYFTLNGELSTFGWSAVIIYLVFGVGWLMALNSSKEPVV